MKSALRQLEDRIDKHHSYLLIYSKNKLENSLMLAVLVLFITFTTITLVTYQSNKFGKLFSLQKSLFDSLSSYFVIQPKKNHFYIVSKKLPKHRFTLATMPSLVKDEFAPINITTTQACGQFRKNILEHHKLNQHCLTYQRTLISSL